jgi:hypothetical protein
LGVPLLLLALCYAWLALDRGSTFLWSVQVHESGRYTLRDTVLYFEHFLREIPTDLAYASFLLVGFLRTAGVEAVDRRRARAVAGLALGAAAAVAAIAFVVATARAGAASSVYDLFQFRTRDDLLAFGSHWRFHWLSTLWFGAAVPLVASALVHLLGRIAPVSGRGAYARGEWIAWGYFVVLTIVFGLSTEVFADIRYVGHQAREILTHGTMTLLLALGVLHLISRRLSGTGRVGVPEDARIGDGSSGEPRVWSAGPRLWLRLGLSVGIPAYLAAVSISGDVLEAGQAEHGLAAMVGGHLFEHALDYLFVVLLVVGGYGAVLTRRRNYVASERGPLTQ